MTRFDTKVTILSYLCKNLYVRKFYKWRLSKTRPMYFWWDSVSTNFFVVIKTTTTITETLSSSRFTASDPSTKFTIVNPTELTLNFPGEVLTSEYTDRQL